MIHAKYTNMISNTAEGLSVVGWGERWSHTLLILNAGSETTKSAREALVTDGT